MDPLVTDIITDVQALFGEPVGGDVYTAGMLSTFIGTAYRDAFSLMLKWNLPLAERDSYGVLPANNNRVTPAQLGISNFGEAIKLHERGGVVTASITDISDTTPVQITTATPHKLSTGVICNVYGITDAFVGLNGSWFPTVIDATTFTLNGSVTGGAGSTGNVAFSTERWTDMDEVQRLPQVSQPPTILRWWEYENGTFYFNGASTDRQLWIEHSVSGDPPTSGNIGIDNSRDFLAYRAASLAGSTRDEDRAATFNQQACGASGVPDGTGGFLNAMMVSLLHQKNRISRRQRPFRERRHNILIQRGLR